MALPGPLVSAAWLAAELKKKQSDAAGNAPQPPLTLLDASWFMPATGRSGRAEFAAGPRIPGSRFFDIDAVSDGASALPHMLPSAAVFAAAVSALGIQSPSSPVIVYDRAGVFSAPRAWYTFLALGHDAGAVAVLDGGLPAWVALGEEAAPLESGPADATLLAAPADAAAQALGGGGVASTYASTPRPAMVCDAAALLAAVASSPFPLTLLDARPAGRFAGTAPEPRRGLRSGHIPGAVSLPFGELLEAGGTYKKPGALRAAFKDAAGFDPGAGGEDAAAPAPPVFTCGTGVTACILALGAAVAAKEGGVDSLPFAVYDGSWTEWAGKEDTPKEPPGGGVLAE